MSIMSWSTLYNIQPLVVLTGINDQVIRAIGVISSIYRNLAWVVM